MTINNIVPQDLFLKSIGYDLLNIKLKTYPLDEVIIEKYRAVLTRDSLKERDVFDLYLINKGRKEVLKIDNKLILRKIKSGFLISEVSKDNLVKNCRLLFDDNFNDSDDDIYRLTLIEIDKKDYEMFKKRLFNKLKKICKVM